MTRFLFLIIAIAIFMSFFRLGSVTLFDVDEAVFAEATKEMVQTGNYITPTYNGENRYDKPILFYWLMAVSYKIFGINEFAARFPSAISGILLCITVFLFVRYFYGERVAFYAAISLVLSIYFLVYSHAAVTDMTLTLLITLSLFSFYLSINGREGYLYGLYVFSALAFLTKGLIGIVFPFGVAIVYLLIAEGLAGIKKIFSLKGVLLFLVISMPWYIAQLAINGQEFIEQFLIKHHFRRYTGVISGHRGPFYYYIPALIIGMFPWIAFLPAGLRNAFNKNPEIQTHNSKPNLFAFIWFAFVFVFFSFSTTKLPNYILPAIPAASMLIANGLNDQDERWRIYSHGFIALLSVLVCIAVIVSKTYLKNFGIYDTNWIILIAIAMLLMSVTAFYATVTKKVIHGLLSVLMIAFLSVLTINALPVANNYLQGTLYRFSLYAKERLQGNERIITYKINNPSIVFYSGHRVIRIDNVNELPLLKDGDRLLIAKTKDIEVLKRSGFNLLERDRDYAIFERE